MKTAVNQNAMNQTEMMKEENTMLKRIKRTAMKITCTACAVLSAAACALMPMQNNDRPASAPQTMITAEAATSYTLTPPIEDYTITSYYGWRTLEGQRKFHTGIDMVSKSGKRDVRAVADAKVVMVSETCKKNVTERSKNFGNYIVLQLSDGSIAIYAHLSPGSITVKKNQTVKAGTKIALYGMTGYALGYHLHFEMRPKKYADLSNGIYYHYDRNGQNKSINVNPTVKGGSVIYNAIYKNALKDGGGYIFQNAGCKLFMGTAGNKLTGGTNVQLVSKANATVYIAHYNALLDAWYFVPKKNTGVSLNCFANSVVSKVNVNLYKFVKNDSSQCYYPKKNSDGTFRLASAQNANVCLEAAGYASAAKQGTNIRCFTCGADITQKWILTKIG